MTDKTSKKATSAMWGGRFNAGPAKIMEEINASIDFDIRLYAQDIAGSKAHCAMLANKGIIAQKDANVIIGGLDTILKEIKSGDFKCKRSLEDIHMNVEARLTQLVGDAGERLHTARSRNDQVATDLKIWLRDMLDDLDGGLQDFQEVILDKAEVHAADVMPGFTHLQAAQPITLGHHLLAYVEMLGRDRGRIADCRRRMNECPLGSGALAGTSFPIDRHMTARELGFDGPCANSLDGVSDRDFAMEFLSLAAILAVHLSRLAEEIVLWSSAQFAFIQLSDTFSTGSSIMPQKRNPDAAELVRAKTGRIIGSLNALLIVIKGLPLAYGKDMQEDKEAVFDAADTLALSIGAMSGMLKDATFNSKNMQAALANGHVCATDLADWMVRTLDMPFRQAHHATGRIVKLAEDKGLSLEDVPLDDMQSIEPGITDKVFEVLGIDNSVRSRTSFGGTAPKNVRRAIVDARQRFLASQEKIK